MRSGIQLENDVNYTGLMRNQSKQVLAYGTSYFFLFAAVAALFPYLPLILQSKGLNPSQVGFLMGSYDLFSIAGLMFIGFVYDRIRHPALAIRTVSLISIVLLFFLASVNESIPLIILTLLLGFFVKSPPSLIDALYGQTMSEEAGSYGKVRLGGSLGFFLMALLILLTQWIKGSEPFTIFIGFTFCTSISLLLIIFLPAGREENLREKRVKYGFAASIKTFPPIFWIGLSIAFLSSLSMAGHYTFFSLLLKNQFNIDNVSGFWAIGPILEIPLFYFSAHLLKKYKVRTLWIICLVAGTLRMQVYSLASTVLPLYLIQIVHSLSFGLNHLSMVNLINKKTDVDKRGLAMSIYMAVGMGLSMFTGGILGGIILRFEGFQQLFQLFSLFPLAAIVITLIFLKEES